MNLAQMGLKYSVDSRGRTKLTGMKQQEHEAAMKSTKRQDARRRYEAKQAAKQKKAA